MKKFIECAFIAITAVFFFAARATADGPADCTNIKTKNGPVTGVDNRGVCEYKGVPYAAPPVGELRFRLPQPPEPWTETLLADKFGPDCYQTPMVALGGSSNPIGSEDCLYLNVWAHKRAAKEKKPVMMFIHGGGFQHGSGAMDTYYGARLAATGDVIVVTINYRLGSFGFYMHPTLTEPDGSLEGNYGVYDQIAALKWIRDNIAAFGGDPDNVTIFGESAGGMSIGLLLVSPVAEGLFRKAIIESGPVFLVNKTIEETLPLGESLAPDLGCTDPATIAECLRSAPAKDVLDKLTGALVFLENPGAKKKFPSEPLIGGKLIPESPFTIFREGKYNKDVPVIIGSNKDEFSFFAQKEKLDTTEDFNAKIQQDVAKMKDIIGVNVINDSILDFYKPEDYASPKKAYIDLMGDMAFTCMTRTLANLLSDHGTPVYLYRFAYEPKGIEMLGDWGAFHGSELPFVFGNMTFLGIKFPYAENKKVSKKIRALWAGFAHTGVPSTGSSPAWPRYDRQKQGYMDLASEIKPGQGFKKDQCVTFEKTLLPLFK